MRFLIVLISIVSAVLAQNSYQLPLEKGVWHLVGINGFHHQMPLSQSFESGGRWMQIRENSGAGFTGDYLDATTKNSHTNPNSGDEVYSTITLEIIPNDTNINETIINYELIDKDTTKPMITMYLASQGEGRVADLKIRFQENYQDKRFYIKIDSSIIMEGVFDIENTIENPQVLKPRKTEASTVKKIMDLFDSNLTDNDITKLDLMNLSCQSINCISEGEVVGGAQKMSDANITAYQWSGGDVWKVFASNGINNDFDSFEVGKAYWIKIDAPETGDEMGFILGKGDLKSSAYKQTNFVSNRWNLLSFNDSFIRTAPTAVFVPFAKYNSSDLMVRDNYSREVAQLATNGANLTPVNVATIFNNKIKLLNEYGRNSFKIRAYPANHDAETGVVLISDEDFEISIGGLFSASGQELLSGYEEGGVSYYSSRSDEFLLAFDLNDQALAIVDSLSFQLSNNGAIKTVDLSTANTISTAQNIIRSSEANAIFIDAAFDDANRTVLLAKKNRFYVRDSTHQKLYRFGGSDASESFNIVSQVEQSVNYGADIDETISNINSVSNATKVVANRVGSDEILLTSGTKRGFFVREKGKRSRFTELALSGPEAQGAITKSYLPTALATARIKADGTTYQQSYQNIDLGYSAFWALDFPLDGALYSLQKTSGINSSPEMIVSGVTRSDKTILWRQSDLTIKAPKWRETGARFNLFKLHKDRGYWVYMRSSSLSGDAKIDSIELNPTIITSYSNLFDTSGSNAVAKTENRVDLQVALNASGLDGITTNAGEMAESVTATLEGNRYDLIKIGGTFRYEAILPRVLEQNSSMPKLAIKLTVANGIGSKVSQTKLFDAIRPDTPTYELDLNKSSGVRGAIIIDPIQSNKISIYDNNISNGGANKLIYSSSIAGKSTVDLMGLSTVVYGTPAHPFYDLRVVGSKANGLQSDVRRVFYAPVYKGTEILSSNSDTNATPIRFDDSGQNFQEVVDNNGIATDSGVQIASSSTLATLSYSPIGGSSLTGCTVETSDLFIASDLVASTAFCSSYNGKIFYLYSNNQLAFGTFGDVNGSNAQVLTVIDTNQSITDPRR